MDYDYDQDALNVTPNQSTNQPSNADSFRTSTLKDRDSLLIEHNKPDTSRASERDNSLALSQSSRKAKMKQLKNLSSSYIEKMKFGGVGRDQSDSDEEEAEERIKTMLPEATPMTKRAKQTAEVAKKVKKIGTFATFMSLLKGFVCTAILYLPNSFNEAGWLFQVCALSFSCMLTIFCAHLLIEVRKKVELPSYSDIGERLFGRYGKLGVNITLFCSQTGFTCAYIYFIVTNVHAMIQEFIHTGHEDEYATAALCFVVFTLLCWVRKIEIFAQTHIFADVMILLTLIYVVIFGALSLKENGIPEEKVPPVSTTGWPTGFGFAIYSFEGIGIILPVQDVTKNPESYFKIVAAVIGFVGAMYVFFGMYCTTVWQTELEAIITTQLAGTAPAGLHYTIISLFCVNLLFTYPLMLYPAHIIVENSLYSSWPKTKKRQWTKNLTRTLLVAFTVVFTMFVNDKIDKFLGILGALTCTPIAFTFPALFHLKAVAKTKFQRAVDYTIIGFSLVVMGFCGTMGIIHWDS